MKILHTVATLDPTSGGPARSVPQLARALAAAGHEIGLWAPQAVDYLSDTGPEQDSGLVVFSGDFATALDAFGGPDLVHDHGIWLPCHKTVAGVCAARGIPRVVSPRGMLEPWALNHKKWKKRVAWYLYQRSLLESAAALHATAESEAVQLRKLRLTRPIILAPNGVAVPKAPNAEFSMLNDEFNATKREAMAESEISSIQNSKFKIQNQPRTALFLSRIHPKKGLPLLLEAWAQVRPQGWQLRIVGPDEGGHVAELKELCVKLGLGWGETQESEVRSQESVKEVPADSFACSKSLIPDSCRLSPDIPLAQQLRPAPLATSGRAGAVTPYRPAGQLTPDSCLLTPVSFSGPLEGEEKWTAFREADLFVLPTYSENFGIAVAEAMAYGLPVITTHGAPWKLLEDERCGWWVPVSVDGIATALEDATRRSPEELAAMGERGRAVVEERFSWHKIAADMIASYDWVLGRGDRPDCCQQC